MFYLAENKEEKVNWFIPESVPLASASSESDDFKYEVGDTVYRVTDMLYFKEFKVEGRWRGSTSRLRHRSATQRKCYKVQPKLTDSTFPQNQYETALFRTKEEAFNDRFIKERDRAKRLGDSLRLRKLERLYSQFT
jgi:hypothetical protein